MAAKVKKEYYPGIGKIKFEGPGSKNPLAFRWYDAEAKIAGKNRAVMAD